MLLLVACDNDSDIIYSDGTELSLNLSISGMQTTRSTGDASLNENTVSSIDVFMFREGADEASVHKHFNVQETKVSIKLSEKESTALGNSDFDVIVAANLPSTTTLPATLTRENIYGMSLAADFSQLPQSSFVMKGEGKATKSSTIYTADVQLERVASKFTIAVTTSASFTGTLDGVSGTWVPNTSAIEVKFYGSQNNGTLGSTYVTPASLVDAENEAYKPVTTAAFYSYPRKVRVEQRPFFVIKVPVTYNGVTKDTYYKCIYNRDTFDSNTVYHINANISILGSTTEPKPEVIPEEYYNYTIADWKTVSGDQFNSVVNSTRYLITYAKNYEMDNIEELEIPFTSSHACEVSVVVKYNDYSKSTENDPVAVKTLDPSKYTVEIEQGKQMIRLYHKLDNDWLSTNKNYDVTPFEFDITLQHKGNATYKEVIHVTQNPAVVLTAEFNDYSGGYRYVNNSSSISTADFGGDIGVAGYTKNMFIIRISALPEGSKYMIGDPRQASPWAWDETVKDAPTIAKVNDVKGINRKIENYYPTREDGTADSVIAPVIRIQSAWGRCSNFSNEYYVIKRRAAAYQEGGYPAGRWRMLTLAEAKILAKLNHDDKIPDLFSNTHNFLVASGYIYNGNAVKCTINGSGQLYEGGTHREGAARLCYDEWYWRESQYAKCTPLGQFTWGDLPRNAFE